MQFYVVEHKKIKQKKKRSCWKFYSEKRLVKTWISQRQIAYVQMGYNMSSNS